MLNDVAVHQIDVSVAVGEIPLAAHGGFQADGEGVAPAILHRDHAYGDFQTVLVKILRIFNGFGGFHIREGFQHFVKKGFVQGKCRVLVAHPAVLPGGEGDLLAVVPAEIRHGFRIQGKHRPGLVLLIGGIFADGAGDCRGAHQHRQNEQQEQQLFSVFHLRFLLIQITIPSVITAAGITPTTAMVSADTVALSMVSVSLLRDFAWMDRLLCSA